MPNPARPWPDTEGMTSDQWDVAAQRAAPYLTPGTRVRVPEYGAAHWCPERTGTILGPDPLWGGYYMIRLDQPAQYRRANGQLQTLTIIGEAFDNLTLLVDREPIESDAL